MVNWLHNKICEAKGKGKGKGNTRHINRLRQQLLEAEANVKWWDDFTSPVQNELTGLARRVQIEMLSGQVTHTGNGCNLCSEVPCFREPPSTPRMLPCIE